MKALTCEMCGSTNLIKQDGVFVCQQCGTKYSVEEAKKMMIEGTVSVQGTVSVDNSSLLQNLYVLGRRALTNESIEALDYYKRILEIDPYSKEAIVVTELVYIDNSRNLSYAGGGEDYVNAMSEEEKSFYLNLLKPIFVSDGCYALSNDIQKGLVDRYNSLWGDCFVEVWCESAKETLEDIYDAYTRSLDVLPFEENHLLTALLFYPMIVTTIQKINPSQDLSEENRRIALMKSKKDELDREKERIEQEQIAAKERARQEQIAAKERARQEQIAAKERARQEQTAIEKKNIALRRAYNLVCCCPALSFFGSVSLLFLNPIVEEGWFWVANISCIISIILLFIIYVIHKNNQSPAKRYLLVMIILIGVTAYINYINREFSYTIVCPKCGHTVENKLVVKDVLMYYRHSAKTECHSCWESFYTEFSNFSLFGDPTPTGTYEY